MKKEYIKPDIEVVEFSIVNEITTDEILPDGSFGEGEIPGGWG